jgi:hypothetical protein
VIHIDHPVFGVLGVNALRQRRIAGPGAVRQELSRHGISARQGLRGALAGVVGLPPSARTSTRTALSLLRRRLTLDLSDGGARRRGAPRYTAREAMLLLGADPGGGLRQLFVHERGLRTIRLSEFDLRAGGSTIPPCSPAPTRRSTRPRPPDATASCTPDLAS